MSEPSLRPVEGHEAMSEPSLCPVEGLEAMSEPSLRPVEGHEAMSEPSLRPAGGHEGMRGPRLHGSRRLLQPARSSIGSSAATPVPFEKSRNCGSVIFPAAATACT